MNTEVVYRSDGLFLEQVRPPSSRHWQLDGDRMAVGRDPSSAVYVNDASVSWHHAELVRRGLSWSIVDTRSTNGTFVNDARAIEAMLHADDRIRLGQIELIVKQPGLGPQGRQVSAVNYDVGWQQGNISNIAGSQSNYYQESNLRYIASRRGRARLLIDGGSCCSWPGRVSVSSRSSNSTTRSSIPSIPAVSVSPRSRRSSFRWSGWLHS